MAIALDSNVLLYAAGFVRIEADVAKVAQAQAQAIMSRLPLTQVTVAAQALGEAYHVLARSGMPRETAPDAVDRARSGLRPSPTLPSTFDAALDLAVRHHFQIWDAIILTAAAEAGARWLLSEDMRDGFVWRGVTILNPFPMPLDAVLARVAA